jgi:hypothetical protein
MMNEEIDRAGAAIVLVEQNVNGEIRAAYLGRRRQEW